jgi:hypothetical protein
MQGFLRRVKIVFWTLMIVCPLMMLGAASIIKYNKIPAWEEIIEIDNIATGDKEPGFAAINKSRLSAVLVRSIELGFWGTSSSTMTGTYFIAKGKHYVITAHHGIHGPCWLVTVSHDDQEYGCKKYITKSEEDDYVIMEIAEPLQNRTPIRIPRDLPYGAQWKPSYSLLNKIIYTGYPNSLGPLTLRGDVIGYGDEYLYIFSHAYGGSSGSGVFTKEGKYIGYVVAIDVATTDFGVDILENIVIVAPAFNVDWSDILN